MNQRMECSDVLQPSLPSFVAGRQWGGKPNKLSRAGFPIEGCWVEASLWV